MRKLLSVMIGTLFGMAIFGISPLVRGEGERGILFEDNIKSNAPSNQSALVKSHAIGQNPEDSVFFFQLHCADNGSGGFENSLGIGGTEDVTSQTPPTVDEFGAMETFFDMRICKFCECADLQLATETCQSAADPTTACAKAEQEFEACHTAHESCATFNNARFVFSPLITDEIMPDPEFPDAQRVLFTMTEHDDPIECTGEFQDLCKDDALGRENKLKLTHHCVHLFDAMGKIVKSVSSAYIFSEIQ